MPLSAPFLPRGAGIADDPNQHTLWIFGAGASAHLQFPMSKGFLRSTMEFVTSYFKSPSEVSVALGFGSFPTHFKKPDGSSITKADMFRVKDDPYLAFDCIHLWDYFAPDRTDTVRLQHLRRELSALRLKLSEVGLELDTSDLLETAPEVLIQRIRNIDPAELHKNMPRGRDISKIKSDLSAALSCINHIYFYALSEFNERSRSLVQNDIEASCYDQLVRAFILERNSRVISFNYDTMLDESLFKRCTTSWAYDGIPVTGINGYPVAPGAEADLRYIKPHGSLNMLFCRSCNSMHIQWFTRYVPRGAGNLAADNRRCTRCKTPLPGRLELMDGLVVPPLYDKEVIRGTTPAIEQAFSWANTIVSIGYSFPDQDHYFFECVNNGLLANASERINIWLVLRGQVDTNALRHRLLNRLPMLSDHRFKIEATALAGFEAI